MKIPSNKVSVVFLICVLIVTATIIYSKEDKKEISSFEKNINKNLLVEIKDNKLDDSDGDGLFDWEEILFGTDNKNIDTDGDGTSDYDEIKQNRDPLSNSEDDSNVNYEQKIIDRIQKNPVNNDSLTNKIAIQFAENYFKLRGEDNINESTKELLINELINQNNVSIKLTTKYNSIITFNPINNPDKLLKYANDFFGSQLDIINTTNYLSQSPQINYDVFGSAIMKLSENIAKIETPNQISQKQLDLANLYYQYGEVISNFKYENEDPLLAMINLGAFENIENKIGLINNEIGEYINQSDIIYSENKFKFNE